VRIAIYRCLYAEDFIQESIESILPYVDRVLVAMAPRPWGTSAGIEWKGQWIPWPAQFDNTRSRIAEIDDPRIEVVDDWFPQPRGQWQHLVNDLAIPRGATECVFMEPDCVFHEDEARYAIESWERHRGHGQATVAQIELWRSPLYRIPRRQRDAVWFTRLNGPIGMTGGNGWIEGNPYLLLGRGERPVHVHNFGFCMSERVMLWKHLTALAFAAEINDAAPNPDWYERVWLNWKPGDTNMEISRGEEHTIPAAFPYPASELPALIRAKYGL
jgi:hypothetical protein